MLITKLLFTVLDWVFKMLRRAKNILFNSVDFKNSVISLRETELKFKDRDPFEVVRNFRGFGEYESIAAKQVPSEINKLYQMVCGLNPKCICEIGTYKGGTLYLWCRAAVCDAVILSCDLPGGMLNSFSMRRVNFYKNFARDNQKLYFFPGDSHSQQIISAVKNKLQGQKIDFLFIDGDHGYDGVKKDFKNFGPFVRSGGMIAFHDILPRAGCDNIEVHRLWHEVKQAYRHIEIIDKQAQSYSVGIGLIWID